MKTIEEKAKTYDIALEWAKAYHRNELTGSKKEMMEYIFPQLRESEDERIRKALVAYLKSDFISPFTFCGVTSGMMLDYLEKQKEQKPNYCHHEVDETGWTEEYRKAYYDGWNNCNMQHEQLKAGHKPAEWSEEDEAMLDSVIRIITQIDDLAHEPTFAGPKWTHPYTKEIAWLKSIRPQPKQEWSDEDEKIFNNIIEKAKGGHWIEVNEITWLINRFKSLRPSWKPSEEQMKALGTSIVFHKNDPNTDLLRSLYDDLQKIR